MRFLALALFLLSALLPLAALAGEAEQPLPDWPTPPQIVDPALGLPSPWRYIDGEGRSNSPCLGEISTPACLYDTMVACGSWTPDWDKRDRGSPGYPYGPDWIGGLHPLCDPLRWTPVESYRVRDTEPLGLQFGSLLDRQPGMVLIYRLYGFKLDEPAVKVVGPYGVRPPEVGDTVTVPIHFYCDRNALEGSNWRLAIEGAPSADELWRQLPDSCVEDTNTMALIMREHDEGWWVLLVHYMRTGIEYRPSWSVADAFYRFIRK